MKLKNVGVGYFIITKKCNVKLAVKKMLIDTIGYEIRLGPVKSTVGTLDESLFLGFFKEGLVLFSLNNYSRFFVFHISLSYCVIIS